MLKRLLFLITFLFCTQSAFADTTATGCSSAEIETAIGQLMGATGQTVNVPFTGPCHWSAQSTWTLPANTTVKGAGNISITGGSGNTVIIDDYAGTNQMLSIVMSTSDGVMGNGSRIYGFEFQGGTGASDQIPMVAISGPSHSFSFDHNTLDMQTFSAGPYRAWPLAVYGDSWGSVNHNVIKKRNTGNGVGIVGGMGGVGNQGHEEWAADTPLGLMNNVFTEDNDFQLYDNGAGVAQVGAPNDCKQGGHQVFRYNTVGNTTVGTEGVQTHPTSGSGQESRGCRSSEWYANVFDGSNTRVNSNAADMSSGTFMLWGNSSLHGTTAMFSIHSKMRNGNPYQKAPPPDGWGYCGPAYQTGLVSTNGTAVTLTSGTNFNTSWPLSAGPETTTAVLIGSTTYTIASINSTTSITLTSSAGVQTGAAIVFGSYFNENADVLTGIRCSDQPGNGKGDLLTGARPNMYNSTRGNLATAGATSTLFYPRQQLEPVYEWMNVHACSGCSNVNFYSNYQPDVLISDQEFYLHTGTADPATQQIQTSCSGGNNPGTLCTPFNGTTGTGAGTLALRPHDCVAGVGYAVTDASVSLGTPAWNAGSNSNYVGNLSFQKCTSTNTWTTIYTPYTYPHPNSVANSGGSCTPDHLTFTSQPTGAALGAALGTIQVAVKDSGGTTCTSDTSTVTLAKTGGTCTSMTLNGTVSGSAVAGVFTTTNVNMTVTTGACSLTASDGALTPAVSNSFTIISAGFGGASRGNIHR